MATDSVTSGDIVTLGDVTIDSNHENADQIRLAFAETTGEGETPSDSTPAVAASTASPEPSSSADATSDAPPPVDETSDDDSVAASTESAPPGLDQATIAKTRRRDPRAAVQAAIAKQREAERRADMAEARLDALSTVEKPAPTPAPEPQPDWVRYKAMPTAPKADQFENYDDYTAALATFVTDARQHDYETRRHQYLQAQEQQEAHTAHAAQWQERLAKARTDNPDLDATLDPEVPMSLPMQYLAMESPVGIQLLQYLSANPDDSQRLSTLHPVEAYREMGKLEERFAAAPSTSSGPARGVSHAKPPIQPLGSSPHTPDPHEISDDLSFEEHFKRMNAVDRKRGLL
jgi:transcription elongation GreA/GreB family factor